MELWNGTNWSEAPTYNINAARQGMGAAGTTTAAIVFGGSNPPSVPRSAATEEWNGISWQETADMNTARTGAGLGTSTNAIMAGGNTPPYTGIAEEWTVPGNVTKTISTD